MCLVFRSISKSIYSNTVEIALRVVQFWSEIKLVITKRPTAILYHAFNFRPNYTPQTALVNWVRIKRGYGRTDKLRTDGFNKFLVKVFCKYYPHFIPKDKRMVYKTRFEPFQAISTFPNASQRTKLFCGAARSNCNKHIKSL